MIHPFVPSEVNHISKTTSLTQSSRKRGERKKGRFPLYDPTITTSNAFNCPVPVLLMLCGTSAR